MDNLKIIVASHKEYKMPKESIYLPLLVGAREKENINGFERDDKGENISEKNPYFCELTGLYWAWKNLNTEYIGLVHYRRYFTDYKLLPHKEEKRLEKVLNEKEVGKLLKDSDIILPKKRNYYIETLYSHYKHTMYIEPLDETEKIIKERFPEYANEFGKIKKRKSAHMFNMFIMKKEILNEYCKWLFEILFELEKRVDVNQYDSFHARFFGRVSELLLDVWINTNGYKYKEVKVMDLKPINWIKKGSAFLKAKFTGKKYEKSF